MKMTSGSDKYRKVIEILRKSRPDMIFPDNIENEIINGIRDKNLNAIRISCIIECLFGWIYIGWVRRSLAAAAIMLVALFIYQQAFMLKQVKNISEQVVNIGNVPAPAPAQEIAKRLTLYKISNSIAHGGEISVPENQLKELINSYDDLLVKYRDLLRIIEEDPDLKQLIEKRLNEVRN